MEKAYVAGFFDGEGYIGFTDKRRIEIRITQAQQEVLDAICHVYGGAVYIHKQPVNHKLAWQWVLKRQEDVEQFLEDIYPFLIVKKDKVNTIVTLWKSLNSTKY